MSTNQANNFGKGKHSTNTKTDNSRNELALITPAQKELLELVSKLDGKSFVNALKSVHEIALYGTPEIKKDEKTLELFYLVHLLTVHIEHVLQQEETALFNLINNA